MLGTEQQVLEIIWDMGGEASITTIASWAKISVDYSHLICKSLAEHNYISLDLGIAKLRGKGKLEAAKRKVGSPRKIIIEPSNASLEDKREKLILRY